MEFPLTFGQLPATALKMGVMMLPPFWRSGCCSDRLASRARSCEAEAEEKDENNPEQKQAAVSPEVGKPNSGSEDAPENEGGKQPGPPLNRPAAR